MFNNKDLELNEILVGIRHKKNFSVLDKFGEIIDDIVDNSNSKFPKDYFDGVSTEGFTKTINNSKTKDYIKLTQFDLIYRHEIKDKNNTEEEYNLFFDRFNADIIPLIIDKYNIRDFSRIGIVFSFKYKDKRVFEKSLDNIINNKFSNVNSIRFSEKDTTKTGNLFKGTDDYINKLYSLAIINNIAIFSYDYQHYFNPLKSIFKQCEMSKVVEQAEKALEKDIVKILGENNEKKV